MAIIAEIGETAGRVWSVLDREGPQTLAQLKKKVNAEGGLFEYALGWLAREDKVEIIPEKRTYRIQLK